jgi:hypothetical protein
MLRNALTTTALAALLAGGAFAQDATQPAAPTTETEEEGTAILPETEGDAGAAPLAEDMDGMTEDPAVEQAEDGMVEDPAVEQAEDADPTADPTVDAPAMDQAQDADPAMDAPVVDQAVDPAAPSAGEGMAADGMGMDGFAAVDVTTLSADQLLGSDIVNYENETIATIDDVILTAEGQVDSVVARFGGFLGFGTNRVQLTMDEIEVMQDANEALIVRSQLTPETIEARPAYEGEATN